jgi:UDPglucose 6-dehydrogenase
VGKGENERITQYLAADMGNKALSVIGIGKLGLPLAAYYAHRGYKVIGVDVNQAIVDAVNRGSSPIYEPGLQEILKEGHGRLSATKDTKLAVDSSEITFILVPTPSEQHGSFSTKFTEEAASNIGAALSSKDDFHVVVLTSTVMPGTTEKVIKPILEKTSGKKCGVDFGLCYNPEFIALGSVIKDLSSPDAVLIGESDMKSGDMLSEVYETVCINNPPVARMSTYNAELAKLALNVFVTTKISLANTFAEICEQLPGGDIDAVTRFLGLDSRIGPKYLKGGLGFGGPCFPRDNLAFIHLAKQLDMLAWLQDATHMVNSHQNERIAGLIQKKLGDFNGKTVSILGITYKPNTDVVEASASLETAKELLSSGASLRIYDPAGNDNARRMLGHKNVIYATSVKECLKGTQLCVLATPWDEFKDLTPEDFIKGMEKPVLLDCWRLFNRQRFESKMDYFALGVNSAI